jgi:hypothetical protein
MRIMLWPLAPLFAASITTAATAQEIDWQKVDEAFGRKPAVSGDVHRYGFPRTDLTVTLDGVTIKPALALGGWVAFKPMHGGAMVMGDLVLLEAEKAHPESFQIDPDTGQIFFNVPDAHGIAVVDRVSQKQIGKWPMPDQRTNFPMAPDRVRRQVLVIFRAPAEFGVFSMTGGKLSATAETCGDADDLFIDAKRGRVYVSCGSGFLDVFETKGVTYRRTARIPTVSGSTYVPHWARSWRLPGCRTGLRNAPAAVRLEGPEGESGVWPWPSSTASHPSLNP